MHGTLAILSNKSELAGAIKYAQALLDISAIRFTR